MEPTLCPNCNATIQPIFRFCPTCGKNITDATSPITLSKQIGVYLLSILLPPLGLWPGFTYLRSKKPNGKMVGWIAIILTNIGTVITIALFMQLMDSVNKSINQQLKMYENLGY